MYTLYTDIKLIDYYILYINRYILTARFSLMPLRVSDNADSFYKMNMNYYVTNSKTRADKVQEKQK